MNLNDLIKSYVSQINIMQLATIDGKSPYLCTVHYYSDDKLNFYWSSLPSRRHSKEIEKNPKTAGYVLIHENTPEEDYVIGLTILGDAEPMGSKISREIVSSYSDKLKHGPEFAEKVLSGTSPYMFYKLSPSKIVLFDNKNFPESPRQELAIS